MMQKIKEYFKKIENVYLVIALIAGGMFVFFNPPFAGVPDEGAHYFHALSLAQGDLICSSENEVSKKAHGLAEATKPYKVAGSNDEKVSMGKIKAALLDKETGEMMKFSGAVCSASPLGYLPQSLGLKAGQLLGLSPMLNFYLARLFNFLLATLLVYWAIRLMPFGKIILFVVALLPMTLQQFSSISYDALHISSVFLFIAVVLKFATNPKTEISDKEALWLFAVTFLTANSKMGFLPLLILLFVIPWKKFSNKKKYFAFIAGTFLTNIAMFLIARKFLVDSGGLKEGTDVAAQFLFILQNPFEFLYAIFFTLYDGATFFFESFLFKPGWLNDSLPALWYVFTFVGIILLVRSKEEKVNLEKWQRLLILAVFFAGLAFVFLSLYAFWSKIGGVKVQGVQGRYFLSFFPLLILAFYKSKFDFRFDWIRKNINIMAAFFFLVVIGFAIHSMYEIYYDKTSTNAKYEYEKQLDSQAIKQTSSLEMAKEFKQTLTVKKNDFLGVKIYIPKGILTGKAEFTLRDKECREVIRKKTIEWNGDEISSEEIKFGVVSDSENKEFCFSGELISGGRIPLRAAKGIYLNGKLSVDGIAKEENLVFDLMYKN